jgi:hypothetical protein
MTRRLLSPFLLAALATLVLSAPAAGQTTAKPAAAPVPAPVQSPLPSQNGQLILIRGALAAFDHANRTNNYTVLNALGSPSFRAGNLPEQLAKTFEPFRANKINLGSVMFLNPTLTQAPTITNGRLRMVGTFPSTPLQIGFDLVFEPSDGQWKMFSFTVSLTPVRAPAPVAK